MSIKTYLENRKKTRNLIHVRLPNCESIASTYSRQLPVPMLPETTRQAHILPVLASHSLLFIAQLCDNGRTSYFEDKNYYILFCKKVILPGPKNPATKLWLLPTKIILTWQIWQWHSCLALQSINGSKPRVSHHHIYTTMHSKEKVLKNSCAIFTQHHSVQSNLSG